MAVILRVVLGAINRVSGVSERQQGDTNTGACVADSGEGAGDAPKCASGIALETVAVGEEVGVGCGELHNRMHGGNGLSG
ncbi:hypothetical protein B0H13DRAFT_2138849, partial [Mycena leptocephala]